MANTQPIFAVQNLSNCTLFYSSRPTENNCITNFLITEDNSCNRHYSSLRSVPILGHDFRLWHRKMF